MTKKIGQTTSASVGAANAGEWTINGTTVTISEDGTVTAGDGTEASITVDEDGTVTITIGNETYTATTDSTGKISSLTDENGEEATTSVKLTATEDTAKGTYTYTDKEGNHTIIAVGGKIIDVTAGTDKGVEVGSYKIEGGTVSGTFDEAAFTATTDDNGRIAKITIGTDGIPLTYKSNATDYTLKADDDPEQETPDQKDEELPYAFDFSAAFPNLTYSSKVSTISGDADVSYQKAVFLNSASGKLRVREEGQYINFNSAGNTEAQPAVGATLAVVKPYVGVDLSKLSTNASSVAVTFEISANGSDNGSTAAYVFLADATGKVLAVETINTTTSGTTTLFPLSATVSNTASKVYLGFCRGKKADGTTTANGGGIDIKGITVTNPDAAQDAPAEDKFAVTAATKDAADGSITITADLTNANGAKLEYKLSSASEWTDATASLTNLANGTYQFRYGATASFDASDVTSIVLFGVKSAAVPENVGITVTGATSSTTTVATIDSDNKVVSVAKGTSDITYTDAHGNNVVYTATVTATGTITLAVKTPLGLIASGDTVEITSEAADLTSIEVAENGDPVVLSADVTIAAANPEKVTYQWYKGSDAIEAATAATLKIPVTEALTATYKVEVTGTVSGAEKKLASAAVNVEVKAITKLTESHAIAIGDVSAVTFGGDPIALTATITGSEYNEGITYAWYKGSVADTNKLDGTGATLSYPVTAADATAGSVSFIVTATGVNSNVTITSQAKSVTVNKEAITDAAVSITAKVGEAAMPSTVKPGTTVVLTANVADGYETTGATYQWKKGEEVISGATSATYSVTIEANASDGTTTYSVTVTVGNNSGTASKDTVVKAASVYTLLANEQGLVSTKLATATKYTAKDESNATLDIYLHGCTIDEWGSNTPKDKRFNFGGSLAVDAKNLDNTSKTKNYARFTAKAGAKVSVTFFSGSAGRSVKILSSSAEEVKPAEDKVTGNDTKNVLLTETYTIADAGDYYIGSLSNGIYITEISVEQ